MTIFRGAALAAATVALIGAAYAGAAGPTRFFGEYTVGGTTVPGLNTGLVLQGQSVTVSATGAACPFGDAFCPGPDGYPWDTTSSAYGGFPLPGAPAWGLVGKVGAGPWVQVGSGPTVLSGTGALVFAVNDDLLGDNAGSFTVTVSYSCWPGWGYGDVNHDHCGPPGLVGKGDAGISGDPAASGEQAAQHGNGQSHGGNGKAVGRKADR